MFFAQDAQTKALRHVREVPTGLKCGCICCGCGEAVEAVNAQAEIFKKRPHFRHVSQNSNADCQTRSIDLAVSEALAKAVVDLRSVLLPGSKMFDAQPPPVSASIITSFELIDTCEGLLCLPDGRKLRVQISTHVIGGSRNDERFDMTLTVPSEIIEEGWNVENLRRYLTTDPNCWRWCIRQTSPSIFNAPTHDSPHKQFTVANNIPAREIARSDDKSHFIPQNVWIQDVEKPRVPNPRGKPYSIVVRMSDGSKKVIHRWTCPDGSMGEEMEIIPPEFDGEHEGNI